MPESGFKFGTKARKSNWIGKTKDAFGVQPSPPLENTFLHFINGKRKQC